MINVSAVRGIFPLQYIFTSAWWKRTKPFLESESSKIVFSLQLLNWIFSCSSYICLKHVDGESILYINYMVPIWAPTNESAQPFFLSFDRYIYLLIVQIDQYAGTLDIFLDTSKANDWVFAWYHNYSLLRCESSVYMVITGNYNNNLLNIGFTSFGYVLNQACCGSTKS